MKASLVDVKSAMGKLTISVCLLLASTASSVWAGTSIIRYVDLQQITKNAVILDTRALTACRQRTLAGAHCLPATDLMGKNSRLPSFADIFWALGTVGLNGSETVLVVGEQDTARDFVAGILYLCGQAKIEVMTTSVKDMLSSGRYRVGRGQARQMLRSRVYRATMRDSALILQDELQLLSNSRFHANLIDAGKIKAGKFELEKIRQGKSQNKNHVALYIVYAANPSAAIALFARLLNEAGNAADGIKVVPVSIRHVSGSGGQDTDNYHPEIFGSSSTTNASGDRLWS